jgi:hypothetical protein
MIEYQSSNTWPTPHRVVYETTAVKLLQFSRGPGARDDITPSEQSLALQRFTRAQTYVVDAGHIGVFMSKKGIRDVWNGIFASLDPA